MPCWFSYVCEVSYVQRKGSGLSIATVRIAEGQRTSNAEARSFDIHFWGDDLQNNKCFLVYRTADLPDRTDYYTEPYVSLIFLFFAILLLDNTLQQFLASDTIRLSLQGHQLPTQYIRMHAPVEADLTTHPCKAIRIRNKFIKFKTVFQHSFSDTARESKTPQKLKSTPPRPRRFKDHPRMEARTPPNSTKRADSSAHLAKHAAAATDADSDIDMSEGELNETFPKSPRHHFQQHSHSSKGADAFRGESIEAMDLTSDNISHRGDQNPRMPAARKIVAQRARVSKAKPVQIERESHGAFREYGVNKCQLLKVVEQLQERIPLLIEV
ncbi:hypothetical protein B0O99DRAFT_695239 [Bisporella sp. PMI_857]|nr:hypothetical protein B0O99DRAFT_695239 [Bisporella sp. PMI_857]